MAQLLLYHQCDNGYEQYAIVATIVGLIDRDAPSTPLLQMVVFSNTDCTKAEENSDPALSAFAGGIPARYRMIKTQDYRLRQD
jgi:hypothetical protein